MNPEDFEQSLDGIDQMEDYARTILETSGALDRLGMILMDLCETATNLHAHGLDAEKAAEEADVAVAKMMAKMEGRTEDATPTPEEKFDKAGEDVRKRFWDMFGKDE